MEKVLLDEAQKEMREGVVWISSGGGDVCKCKGTEVLCLEG